MFGGANAARKSVTSAKKHPHLVTLKSRKHNDVLLKNTNVWSHKSCWNVATGAAGNIVKGR